MSGIETATTVTLMSGRVISIEAFNLALALAERGIIFVVRDGRVICTPAKKLTTMERAAVQRLSADLIRVALCCARAM